MRFSVMPRACPQDSAPGSRLAARARGSGWNWSGRRGGGRRGSGWRARAESGPVGMRPVGEGLVGVARLGRICFGLGPVGSDPVEGGDARQVRVVAVGPLGGLRELDVCRPGRATGAMVYAERSRPRSREHASPTREVTRFPLTAPLGFRSRCIPGSAHEVTQIRLAMPPRLRSRSHSGSAREGTRFSLTGPLRLPLRSQPVSEAGVCAPA